jgi:hypothetical protein
MKGIFNLSAIDTETGVGGIFSLDKPTENGCQYIEEMKGRYRDLSWKQRIEAQIAFINKPRTQRPQIVFSGPYVNEAKTILEKLGARL